MSIEFAQDTDAILLEAAVDAAPDTAPCVPETPETPGVLSKNETEETPFSAVLRNAQYGDEQAFAELWNRTSNSARHPITRIDRQGRTEDLMATTAMKAFRYLGGYEIAEEEAAIEPKFRAWLIRIATNESLNELRRDSRRVATTSLDADRTDDGATLHGMIEDARFEQPQDEVTSRDNVLGAVALLPENFREVYQLVEVEDLSYKEAAERLGRPIGTVMSRLSRAKAKLREIVLSGQAGEDLQEMAASYTRQLETEKSVA